MSNVVIKSNGSIGSATISDIISSKGTDDRSAVWGNSIDKMEVTNEEMILASVGYSWGESLMVSFSSEFYSDVERHISELENYEVVYLLKSKFTK